jgi:hypothetical protein
MNHFIVQDEADQNIREILRKVDPLEEDFNNNAGNGNGNGNGKRSSPDGNGKRSSPDGKLSDDSGIRGDNTSVSFDFS